MKDATKTKVADLPTLDEVRSGKAKPHQKMDKSQTATQTATAGKGKKDSKSKDLNDKNKAIVTEKAIKEKESESEGREVKYIYPADCTTKDQKKTFRRTARQMESKHQKTLAKLRESNDAADKKALKTAEKQYEDFHKETYTNPSHN